jgi:predicted dehydrogenase
VTKAQKEEFTFDICDQYALEGVAFSGAILKNTAVPTPLEDAVRNMEIIDAIIESGKKIRWEHL